MKPVKKRILHDDGYKYLGFCLSKLAALEQLRGAGDMLRKSFYLPDDLITIVMCGDEVDEITIMKITIYGFLFHPRTGNIEWANYRYFTTIGQHMARFPYVYGTGWDFKGADLPGTPVEYPLTDNDHGTRRISRKKNDEEWSYYRYTAENYGNIDWKGPNTAEPDAEPNNIILTWKGPPSRYFAEGMKYRVTDKLYYDRNIYQGGYVVGTLPFSERQSQVGDDVPYYVLGAAVAIDSNGVQWLVAVGKEYHFDVVNGAVYSNFRVMAQRLNKKVDKWYDEENEPDGWHIIYEGGGGVAASAPFHFNASGTEASTVSGWQVYTLTVNIDGLSASLEISNPTVSGEGHIEGQVTDGPYSGWSGAIYLPTGEGPADPTSGIWLQPSGQSFVGTSDYTHGGMGVRDESVTAVVAVDYIGDTKITATIEQTIHAEHDDSVRLVSRAYAGRYPGHTVPERAGYDGVSTTGITNSSHRTVNLKFGTSDIRIYDETVYNAYRTKYQNSNHILEYVGNEWSVVTETVSFRSENVEENRTIAGAVIFLDLRHNIAVVAEQDSSSKIASYTGQYQYLNGVYSDKPDEHETSGHFFCKVRIHGAVPSESDWYDGFVTTDDDDHITPGFPAWVGTVQVPFTWPVNTIHFRYSNQPIGSWAVDRNGNHFYSMLKKDGTHNYLTGGDPVTLTETVGDNPVFFPIAPI